jgi:helicase
MTQAEIDAALQRLFEAGLVEQVEERFRLTGLGKVAGELGIQVESVVRVGRALRGLPGSLMTGGVLLAGSHMTVELDDVIFPIHRKSVQERERWQGAIASQGLPRGVLQELSATDDAHYTARCKRLVAVQMWLEGMELSRIEASILRHLPGDNAAGPIRASAERTRDLIGVVARIGALVSSDGAEVAGNVDDIHVRLELGIPNDMLWLARQAKRSLERGDYLALKREGLASPEAIEAGDDAALTRAVKSEVKRSIVRAAVASLRSAEVVSEDDAMPVRAGDL